MSSTAVYIANDVECAGPMVGRHSVISWGACLVTPKRLSGEERIAQGLTFYAELKPHSHEYSHEAMKVACLGLSCLKDKGDDPRYNPKAREFSPIDVLCLLDEKGDTVADAIARFRKWVSFFAARDTDTSIVPVVDTTFFDPPFIQHLFSVTGEKPIYRWNGIDLRSLYAGYARDMNAGISELGMKDTRVTPHCALDDAIFIAQIAGELIFNRIPNRSR